VKVNGITVPPKAVSAGLSAMTGTFTRAHVASAVQDPLTAVLWLALAQLTARPMRPVWSWADPVDVVAWVASARGHGDLAERLRAVFEDESKQQARPIRQGPPQ
jgi:hypothetical protein